MNINVSRVLLIASVAGLFAGCTSIDNDRVVIGGARGGPEVSLTALQSLEEQEVMSEATEPSTTTLDRSHWQTQIVLVPNDGTEHHLLFTDSKEPWFETTARARREMPTTQSALELHGPRGIDEDIREQVGAMFAAPFVGGLDVVMFLPRLVLDHPTELGRSPQVRAARASEGGVQVDIPELDPQVAPMDDPTEVTPAP